MLGWVGGFLVAAVPSGPLTMLFFHHVLLQRWRDAARVAAIIAVSDTLYGLAAAHGHDRIVAAHPAVAATVRVIGILVVAWLGIRLLLRPPAVADVADADAPPTRGATLEALAVAAFNPSALVTWIVLVDLARAWVAEPMSPGALNLLAVGIGLGAASWFFGALAVMRTWVRPVPGRKTRALVRVVGALLVATAVSYAWRSLLLPAP